LGQARNNTQHLAWAVLLVSFAVFCVICLVSGIGVHYFLFKSTVPMQTVLTVGRGTTIVTNPDLSEQPVRSQRDLDNRSVISTDSVGQAILSFYDQQQQERRLVATVVMNSSTSVDVEELSRPRFDWSTAGYEIHLDKFTGRFGIVIPDGIGRTVQMSVETSQGARVWLRESGQYSITANEAQVRVEVFSGSAELTTGQFQQVLSDGDRIMYNLSANEMTPLSPYVRLLGTNAFDESNVFASNPEGVPSAWGCFSDANDITLGLFGLTTEDGRSALHFQRAGGTVAHGESVCSLALMSDGRPGIDVTGLGYLSLEVTFRIDGHSLSGCGQDGSECPLMLRLDYVPSDPDPRIDRYWIHGFYVWNSQPAFPLICQTCRQEHEAVNGGVWYTYRSENLFGLIPTDRHPTRLLAMKVYASGHEYDVYVSEVSLFASEQIDPVPVGDPSLQG
jgi:hypothetical protein